MHSRFSGFTGFFRHLAREVGFLGIINKPLLALDLIPEPDHLLGGFIFLFHKMIILDDLRKCK